MKQSFLTEIKNFVLLKANIVLTILLFGLTVVVQMSSLERTINETWIYSASMQTLAAMIALLPISFSFYLRKVDDERGKSYDRYILKRLEKNVYYEMMFVICMSVITIILNLGLLALVEGTEYILLAIFFTLLSIQYVTIYIYRLFDPDRVSEILKELDTATDSQNSNVTLDQFITRYLELETAVKNYLTNEPSSTSIERMPLYDIVDQFSQESKLIEADYTMLKDIIFHRNNLIHNYTEVNVSQEKYDLLDTLIDKYRLETDRFISRHIFLNTHSVRDNIVHALQDFLKEDSKEPLKDVEETILNLLSSYLSNEYTLAYFGDEKLEFDFELLMNNYSKRKLVGIELKAVKTSAMDAIAKRLFKQNKNYRHIFVVNYNREEPSFELMYQMKNKNIRYERIR